MDTKKIMLLHWTGRFGNRMFLYAFGCQYAKTYGCTFYIPSEWEGTKLFEPCKYAKIIPDDDLRLHINQTHKEMDTLEYRKWALNQYKEKTGDEVEFILTNDVNQMGKTNVAFDDLSCMYFPHIFKMFDKTFLANEVFKFKESVMQLPMIQEILAIKQTYDVVHWRRGDIASKAYKGAHSLVSQQSIDQALGRFRETQELPLIFVSDDTSVRTQHIKDLNLSKWYKKSTGHSWSYPVGEHVKNQDIIFDWLFEFFVIMNARTVYRGNSAFSWWASFFGQLCNPDINIYAPVIRTKPNEFKNKFWEMDCAFRKGNDPHFMGSKEEGFHDIHIESMF